MADFTRQDYDNFFDQQRRDAVARALPQEGDDAERAARANQISGLTGLDPSVVYGNTDSIEQQFRANLTGQLVRQSPEMQGYINSHPLAAKVSADDWGNLHNAWEASKKFPPESGLAAGIRKVREVMDAPLEAMAQDFSHERAGSWIADNTYNEMMKTWQGRVNYYLFSAMGLPLELPFREFNAAIKGVGTAARLIHDAVGGSPSDSESFQNEFETFLNVGLMGHASTGVHIPVELQDAAFAARQAIRRARPYTQQGLEPPVGVDLSIDYIKAQQAKFDADALKEAMSQWRGTQTTELSPDMAVRAAQQVYGNREMGISGDVVRALYGDKVPGPDDGLLGWVPDIREQLAQTEISGGDIKVPMADWMVHVEPEIATALHDHIRARRGGLTLDEAKNLPPVEESKEPSPPPGQQSLTVFDTTGEPLSRQASVGEGERPRPQQEVNDEFYHHLARMGDFFNDHAQHLPLAERARLGRVYASIAERIAQNRDPAVRQREYARLHRDLEREVRGPSADWYADLQREMEDILAERSPEEAAASREALTGEPPTDVSSAARGMPRARPEARPVRSLTRDEWQEYADRQGYDDYLAAAQHSSRLEGHESRIVDENGDVTHLFRNGRPILDEVEPPPIEPLRQDPIRHTVPEWTDIADREGHGNIVTAAQNASRQGRDAHILDSNGETLSVIRDGTRLYGRALADALEQQDALSRLARGRREERADPIAHTLSEWRGLAREEGIREENWDSYVRELSHDQDIHVLYSDGTLARAYRNGDFVPMNELQRLRREYADLPEEIEGEHTTPQDFAPSVEDTISSTRRSAGIERRTEKYEGKAEIKETSKTGPGLSGVERYHYDIVGESGEVLGDMSITYNTHTGELYVPGMRVAGYQYGETAGNNILGMRNIIRIRRQVEEMFPNRTTTSANRVGGARKKSGTTGMVKVKFSHDDPNFNDALYEAQEQGPSAFDPSTGEWIDLENGNSIIPTGELNAKRQQVFDAVDKIARRIAPQMFRHMAVKELVATETGRREAASYTQFRRQLPYAIWAFDGGERTNPVTAIRHELIHHLRQYGFFTGDQWVVLEDAAIRGNWIEKHGIAERYPGHSVESMLEEAIADEFASRLREKVVDGDVRPLTGIDKAFAPLRELWEGIRTAVRRVFGRDVDFRDLFHMTERGKIGRQKPSAPLTEGAYRPEPGEETRTAKLTKTLSEEVNERLNSLVARQASREKQPELPGVTRMEDRDLLAGAGAIGTTKKTYGQLQAEMVKEDARDAEFVERQVQKEITRRQTKEWKDRMAEVHAEIVPQIHNRPDISADRFLREGILYDQKIQGRPRLDSLKLTEEQKKSLPDDYHRPGGIDPDDAASLFGYRSGDELVDRVAGLVLARGNKGPRRFINDIVAKEVEQRMRLQHGDLAQNILDEVQEHVFSQDEFNRLSEEFLQAGTRLGQEMSLTKEDIQRQAKDYFDRMTASKVDLEDFLRNALRASDLSGRALLNSEATEAFKQLQRRMLNVLFAREMKKFEKVQKTLERLEKKYSKREVGGVDPEYKDRIHQLMMQYGMDVRRTPNDLATEMAERGDKGTLQEWVDETNGDYGSMQLDDRLYDPTPKKVDQLTTDEYRALSNGLKTLDKAARDSLKVLREGASEDKASLIGRMREQMKANRDLVLPKNYRSASAKAFMQKAKHMATVGLLNPETWLNRFDMDNVRGLFNQWIVRPLTSAANREATLLRKYSKRYADLGEIENADKKIAAPFNDVATMTEENPDGFPRENFTMSNVAAMVSNIGNRYQREVLFKGLGLDEKAGMEWLAKSAPRALWDRAEKLGRIFNDLFEESQTVYRSIYGEAPEKIELEPFAVQLADGSVFQSEGWYHPIIRDIERTNSVRKGTGEEMMEQHKGLFPTIANGYTKRRTGKIDVLDLSHDMIPYKMTQIIHDTAFRAEVVETAKLIRDKDFQKMIRQYAGPEYLKMLETWLKDIAGSFNEAEGTRQTAKRISDFFRTNTIGTLIGFNPSTVAKHGPTAFVNSMYEVGSKAFLKAFGRTGPAYIRDGVASIFTRDEEFQNRTLQFIWDNSEEIRRRIQNWRETMGGARQQIEGKSSVLGTMRSNIIEWGSKPVAISDMISALPTWLAAYEREMAETGVHGDAVFAGDRAVRRAHGSTAPTNLPELMRKGGLNPWLTSLYGFFGTQMQRRAEIVFKLNDANKLRREGEIKKATGVLMKEVVPLVFASMIWPTIVEELVTGYGTDDHRTGLQRLGEGALQGLLSSVLLARELRPTITGDHAPSVGILSTALEDIENAVRVIAHPVKSMDRQHAAKSVQSLITAAGIFTGMSPTSVGHVARYVTDTVQGTTPNENIPLGLVRGTEKLRVVK